MLRTQASFETAVLARLRLLAASVSRIVLTHCHKLTEASPKQNA